MQNWAVNIGMSSLPIEFSTSCILRIHRVSFFPLGIKIEDIIEVAVFFLERVQFVFSTSVRQEMLDQRL